MIYLFSSCKFSFLLCLDKEDLLLKVIQFLHVNGLKRNIKQTLFLESQLSTVLVNSASFISIQTCSFYCSVTVVWLVVENSFCSLFKFSRCYRLLITVIVKTWKKFSGLCKQLLKPPFTDSYSQPRVPLILSSILIVSFQFHLGNRYWQRDLFSTEMLDGCFLILWFFNDIRTNEKYITAVTIRKFQSLILALENRKEIVLVVVTMSAERFHSCISRGILGAKQLACSGGCSGEETIHVLPAHWSGDVTVTRHTAYEYSWEFSGRVHITALKETRKCKMQ